MTEVFSDTFYFVALIDRADQFHRAAVLLAKTIREPMVTTSAVILELGAHFSRSPVRPTFAHLLSLIEEAGTLVVHVDKELQDRGVDMFEARKDKDWSLVDCISFCVMADRSIQLAAASDVHFEQAAFTALLRRSDQFGG